MKKLPSLFLALLLALPAAAQEQDTTQVAQTATDSLAEKVKLLEQQVSGIKEDQKMAEIWKRKKYIGLATGHQTLTNQDLGLKYKSEMAFALQWDWWHIRFHKKPIAKVLMIGLDIALDLNFAKYKDIEVADEEIINNDYAGEDEGDDVSDFLSDLDMMQLDAGIAVGPIVQVAPFSYTSNAAQHLKAFAYYHLTPSFSGIYADEKFNGAFNMFHGIGFGVTWKFLSIGFEHRFGSAKYDALSFEDYEVGDDVENVGDLVNSEKVKYKTKANRFFLRINF